MIWFFVFLLLGLIAVIFAISIYCRFRKLGFWSFIWDKLKWVALAIGIIWLLIAIVCYRPLYNTAQCYFRGVSMHSDTKYSWYLGECQIRTKTGSYVPIRTTRGLPDGSSGQDNSDDIDAYSY